MNYWLTTQWPGLEDEDSQPTGVYLTDDRKDAGRDMFPGDYVFIYKSLTGRDVVKREYADGQREIIKSLRGEQGIVALAEITTKLTKDPGCELTHYSNGTSLRWNWYARIKIVSEGFVPLCDVNKVLGYSENSRLRGFGDRKSGLKKLTKQQYLDLLNIFKKKKSREIPALQKVFNNYRKRSHFYPHREGEVESKEHRLLKEYVAANPVKALREEGLKTLHVEYNFPTADRADLVLEDQFGRIIGLEIEVAVGLNQMEGVLQAIKYRFMLAPMKGKLYKETRAFLVAYDISPEVKKICRIYEVECFTVTSSDVKKWEE